MKYPFLVLAVAVLLAGCATSHEVTLTVLHGVRAQSTTSDKLFHDVLTQRGGVGFADYVKYPNSTQKTLTNIQVITPYENGMTGVERWTIQHDGKDSCTYQVKFIPDGLGGTTFIVQREISP